MVRCLIIAWLLPLAVAPGVSAQEWATKMFESTTHDFGALARGTKAQAHFKLKNVYEENVHISGVRSSCGCTIPQIVKADLKTFEAGEIVADFNTRDFLGQKTATITVSLDKPFPAEVQLHVSGFIRSDVVVQPGAVDFGAVDFGTNVQKRITVTYAGRDDWELLDVKSGNPHIAVEMVETGRGNGKVSYDLTVQLTKDAPVGYLKDQLILVTNDSRATDLAVDLQAQVTSEITVSPASLFMGIVEPGSKVTKQLVVRGKRPFKILDVKCDDASFEIHASDASKTIHLIPVVFTAGEAPGKITRQIVIETDQGAGVQPKLTAYAQVVKAEPPNEENGGNETVSFKSDP